MKGPTEIRESLRPDSGRGKILSNARVHSGVFGALPGSLDGLGAEINDGLAEKLVPLILIDGHATASVFSQEGIALSRIA